MATRGAFTLLELLTVVAIVGLLLGLTLSAVMTVRQSALRAQCAEQLRQIGLALHGYHARFHRLPPGVVHPRGATAQYGEDKDPYPLMTWQTRLLPFLERDALWTQVQEAYRQDPHLLKDPPHAAAHLQIPLFICPADGPRTHPERPMGPHPASTSYLGVSGVNWGQENGVFYRDSDVRFAAITDGLSNTVAVGERPPSRDLLYGRWYGGWGPWGDVNSFLGVRELTIGPLHATCAQGPWEFAPGRLDNPCSVFHFWSFHSGGGNFLFADGSVRFLAYSSSTVLPALATRAGAETATAWD